MPRVKSKNTGAAATSDPGLNIKIGDVTEAIFPEGTPKNPDGSVAQEGEITIEQARKVGAVTPEAAQYNKRMAKTVHKKLNGEKSIAWGETDALQLFDSVKLAYPGSLIYIYIKKIEPLPIEDYQPVAATNLKTGLDFYNYIARNIHKNSPASTYQVLFKQGNGGRLANGVLNMPDTTAAEVITPLHQPQQGFQSMSGQLPPFPPFPPYGYGGFQQPGYPYPSQSYPQPQPYIPQPYGPQPYPQPQGYVQTPQSPEFQPQNISQVPQQMQQAPQQQAPQQAQQVQAPPQPSQIVNPLSVPNGYQPYMQPPPPQQPVTDPAVMGALGAFMEETRRMHQVLQHNQLQMATALGTLEEMKRNQHQPLPPFPYTQPQVAAPVPTPAPAPIPEPPTNFPGMPGGYIPQQQFSQQQPSQMAYAGQYVPVPQQQMPQMPQQYPQYGQPQPMPPPGYPQLPPPPGYGFQMYPGYPPGYGPYPPPGFNSQPQQPAVAANPLSEIQKAVGMISGFSKAMKEIQNVTNPSSSGVEEEISETPEVHTNPLNEPFKVMPLGGGSNPAMMAYNPGDGSVNWIGTLMGNAPKIAGFVQDVTNAMAQSAQIQNGQLPPQYVQQMQAPQNQHFLPQAPVQVAAPIVQRQVAPTINIPIPTQQPTQSAPQSMIPSMDAIRTATGA